ncbi:MAG: copper-binding protein [Proteobacteria bacterium]|nr:copper-binding protein [Pseudomonadota bacterium]
MPTLRSLLIATTLTLAALAAQAAEGEVQKIDTERGTVRLKHGEIKSLDMPPMVMTFRVRQTGQLKGLAEGDKVTFEVEKDGSQYVVTVIRKR